MVSDVIHRLKVRQVPFSGVACADDTAVAGVRLPVGDSCSRATRTHPPEFSRRNRRNSADSG